MLKSERMQAHKEKVEREINYAKAQLAMKMAEMEEYITIHGKEQNCTTARAMKNEMVKLEDEIDVLLATWQGWDDLHAEALNEEVAA